ncbi:MAG: VirB4 family type IV secretion system protein, partial [Mycoplasmoidaceae bacterium]
KQKEFEEVVRKMFFVNNKIVEYKNYVKTVDENNNVVFNRFIELKQLPFSVYREWLSLFFNQQGISIYLRVNNYLKEDKLNKKVNNILAITEHKLNTISFHNKFRQEELERMVISFNDLIVQLGKGEELKKVSMVIKVEGKTKEETYANYKSIIENINSHKFKFDRMSFQQIKSLSNFVPNGNDILPTNNYVDVLSTVLCFGSPFNSLELLHANSSILAKDKNNTPISINFKLRNELISSSSMTILGKTGSGKTTTTKRIIKNNIIDGGFKIFCVDPENEYGELIESFGGVIIDNTNPKHLINPFEMKENKENSFEENVKNKMSTITNFLEMLFSGVLDNSDIKIIIHIINKMYYKHKYSEFTFSDIYKELEKNAEVKQSKDILIQFRDYCKCANGTNASYWDDKSRLNINNDYICFQYKNLINLPQNLGFALIYNSFEYINSVVMNNMNSGKYISIFIDEAHLLLNDKHIDVVKRVVELYKRIRKYNGMITIITQNITDLYKSNIKDYTSVIMNNSQYLLIHTIKPTEIPELENLLKEDGGLSPEEKEFLRSGSSGDCILMFGKKRTQIRVIS